ncbi:MAG: hypothetical protein E6X21_02035 [Clostridium sp.]|uniref:hypothetical protein n=1 Tax=Clostridium sp. TaxID=1506 RepID=UPI002908320C|nr:hypothetical protein [Clostridium sp.]
MKLYEYLENKWNNDKKLNKNYNFTLNEFMTLWMENNLATDSVYEEFIGDDFIGIHSRDYEIDHENKKIELLMFN